MPDDASSNPRSSVWLDFLERRRGQRADPAAAEARARAWAEENAEGIARYNAYVREHGTLADDLDEW